MKKTYENPVLTTEEFDAEDIITASSPNAAGGLQTSSSVWEVGDIPSDVQFT